VESIELDPDESVKSIELDPTFRTSALDYPRISFGAKFGRGPARYPRPSAGGLDAGAQRLLLLRCKLRRVSHVMIRIIGQLPGPHSLRKDLGTNRMSRRHRIRNGAARSVHPRGLDRSYHAVFPEPRMDLDFSPRVASLGGDPAGRVRRHRHWSCRADARAGVGAGSTRS
jgi:hypothetical protein